MTDRRGHTVDRWMEQCPWGVTHMVCGRLSVACLLLLAVLSRTHEQKRVPLIILS